MDSLLSRKISTAFIALGLILCAAQPALASGRKIERRVAPIYPELAKRMHLGGLVRITVTIAANGRVTQMKAVRGNKLLEPAAENAVRQWKFAPDDTGSKENIDIKFVESD